MSKSIEAQIIEAYRTIAAMEARGDDTTQMRRIAARLEAKLS